MRKNVFKSLVVSAMAGLTLCAMFAFAPTAEAAGVAINATNFPDSTFRSYISTNIDKDKNGSLSSTEIAATTSMNVSYKYISDLTGIKYFTALTELRAASNSFKALDLSANTKLQKVYVSGNSYMETLVVNKCVNLLELDASSCALSKLYIPALSKLKTLKVSSNKLTSSTLTLPTSGTALTILDISYNSNYGSVAISKYVNLTGIDCSRCGLSTIYTAKNTKLVELYAGGNPIPSFALSTNTALKYLNVSGCGIKSLYIAKNTALEMVQAGNNYIATIDVSKNVNLKELLLSNNELTKIAVSTNTKLEVLDLDYNAISTLYLVKNTALKQLELDENELTTLDISKNTKLETLDVASNNLSSLIVSSNPALKSLYVSFNPIKSLYLAKNTKLETLFAGTTEITTLSLNSCKELNYLYVNYAEKLETLEVAQCTKLKTITANGTALKSIYLNNMPSLDSLSIGTPNMKSIDTSKNFALTYLNVEGIEKLDIRNNTKLKQLNTDAKKLVVNTGNNNTFDATPILSVNYRDWKVTSITGGTNSGKNITFNKGVKTVNVTTEYVGTYSTEQRSYELLIYTKAPTITAAANTAKGAQIYWGEVTGAAGYQVYRKDSTGKWTKIGETTATNFVDTTANSGWTYGYAVKTFHGTADTKIMTSDSSAQFSNKFLAAPTNLAAANTTTGVKLTWTKVSGASAYNIYRKTGTGALTKIGTVTSGTTVTYTDKTAKSGTAYTYYVKAAYGNYESGSLTGKTITYKK